VSQKPKHYQDPSYAAFAERYRTDIVAFAEEVLGLKVSRQMAEVMRAYSKPGARVAVTANPQEDDLPDVSPLAPLGLWRLFFARQAPNELSLTLVGCLTSKLSNGNDYRRLAIRAVERTPWLAPYMHITGERIYLDGRSDWTGSCIRFVSVRAHCPESMAGFAWGSPYAAWLLEDAHKIAHACLHCAAAQLIEPGASLVLSCRGERPASSDGLGITWEDYTFAGAAMPQSDPKSR
jgi:hypothetical protein